MQTRAVKTETSAHACCSTNTQWGRTYLADASIPDAFTPNRASERLEHRVSGTVFGGIGVRETEGDAERDGGGTERDLGRPATSNGGPLAVSCWRGVEDHGTDSRFTNSTDLNRSSWSVFVFDIVCCGRARVYERRRGDDFVLSSRYSGRGGVVSTGSSAKDCACAVSGSFAFLIAR